MIERCWTVLESTHLPQDAAAISDCKAVVTLVTSSLPTDLIGVEVAARYCNLFPHFNRTAPLNVALGSQLEFGTAAPF